MATINPTSPPYPRYKLAVFALLIGNAALYAVNGTPSRAVDAVAWLLLLALYECEAELSERLRTGSATAALHAVRIAAIVAIAAAAIAYVYEQAWLDVINSVLWFAVAAMLEYELRFPRVVARRTAAFVATATALYAGLALLVTVWAWRGEWFDAYDALLWIIAFATIEMDVLRFSRRAVGAG